MRRRLYWVLPDVDSARAVVDDLLLARVEERHLHFVAREGTDMTGLHPANALQTSDLVRAAQLGLIVGAVTGAVAGAIVAWLLRQIGDAPPWGLVALLAVFGAAFGAWAASMIGSSVPSRRLRRFQRDIEAGRILMMVDVPPTRIQEIEARLRKGHPEATPEGMEPNIPAFP